MRGKIIGHGEKKRYLIDEKEVSKEEFDQVFPDKNEGGDGSALVCWHRPIQSDALAVHPSQITEAVERNRRHGLHIDYNPVDGRPILKDRDQRRRLMKIERVHDNSGGYGDG